MSTPENPLNFYRSYAYQHILFAANSTSALKQLVNDNNFDVASTYNQKSPRKLNDIKANVRTVTGTRGEKNVTLGQYVVMLNSTQDVDFFIEDLSWSSIMIPTTNTGLSQRSVGTEGVMTIIEPNGARFYNYLNNVFNALDCDPAGIVFAIKTIFIGYPTEGHPDINSNIPHAITTIRPFLFSIYDITSKYDETGGTYTISFLGNANGTANISAFSTIPPGTNGALIGYNPGENNSSGKTLEEVLDTFQKFMNKKSIEAAREYRDYITKKTPREVDDKRYKNRPVTYRIILDDEYKNDTYVVDNLPEYLTDATPDQGSVVFSPDESIQHAIETIMMMCSKVNDEASTGVTNDLGLVDHYDFKILTVVDSAVNELSLDEMLQLTNENTALPDGQLPPGLFEIIFYIKRQRVAKHGPQDISKLDQATLQANTIEFDYLYTGKNIDIVEFDMTLNMGFLMYMSLHPYSTFNTQSEQLKKKSNIDEPVVINGTQGHQTLRGQSPIPVAKPGTDAVTMSNLPNGLKYGSARALLNKIATLSAIDCKIKIRGNPDLLNDYSIDPFENVNVGKVHNNIYKQPGLVKVNIRMPVDDEKEDPTDMLMNARPITEPFWFEGRYIIFEILHEFKGGEFTQELSLIALVEDDPFKEALGITEKPVPTTSLTPYTDVYFIQKRQVDFEIEQAERTAEDKLTDDQVALLAAKPVSLEEVRRTTEGFDKLSKQQQIDKVVERNKAYNNEIVNRMKATGIQGEYNDIMKKVNSDRVEQQQSIEQDRIKQGLSK